MSELTLVARQEEMRLRNYESKNKRIAEPTKALDSEKALEIRELRSTRLIVEYERKIAKIPKQYFVKGSVVPEVVEIGKKQKIARARASEHPIPIELKRNGWTSEIFYTAIKAQNGKCAICSVSLSFEGTSGNRACTDHEHIEPPRPRGLLCMTCNVAIGMLKDNPELCESAAEYLRYWK